MQRVDELQTIGEQLALAANAEAVWQIALEASLPLLDATAGAWVWQAPIPQTTSVLAGKLAPEAWPEILRQAAAAPTPQQSLVARAGAAPAGALWVPVAAAAWQGVLVLYRAGQPFDTDALPWAGALAQMARQAVLAGARYHQMAQQYTAAEQRVEELEYLVDVASTVGTTLDLDAALREIVRAVSHVLRCQRTVIFEVDIPAGALNMVAAEGISEHYWQVSQGVPLAAGGRTHAVAVNKMVVSEDILVESPSAAVAALAQQEGFRAFADLPMYRGDKPIGMLSVQFVEPHHFTENELSLLSVMGEQAAIAIENARLYTKTDVELQRRLEALESLQRVTQEITATVDLEYILSEVLREAMRFSQAEAGLVLRFENGETTLPAHQGYAETALAEIQARLQERRFGAAMTQFAEKQESVYLPDVATVPDKERYPAGARALLVTPVFYEQRLAATIMIQSSRPHDFSQVTIEFVEGLAVQTSVAVGNARRYQEQLQRGALLHQRAEQMSLLLEVSRTMRSDRSLEDIMLDVAYAVQEGSGFNVVLISVLEGNYLRRVAGAGIPLADLQSMKATRHTWAQIKRLCQEQFRLGQCYYIPAEYANLLDGIDTFIPEAEDVGRLPGDWHQLDAFLIPLRGSRGDLVGIMSVDDPVNGRAPTAATAEVVELFATQVSLAIENNRLVEDLRRQVNTLSLFNELSRSITTKLDLPLVLNTVVQAVTNLLGYDYATIYIQDQKGQHLIPLASSGYSLELLGSLAFRTGEGLIGKVAQMGMPLVIDDTQADARFIPGPIPVGSTVVSPLMIEGRSVGVLSAERKVVGDFTPAEVAILTSLADQVAVAVENARLFEEVKRFSVELEERVAERTQELAEALEDLRVQSDRSEVLYHIASELVASLDMERVLSQALLLLQKAVRASKSSVILVDRVTGQLVYRAAIGHTEPIPPGGRVAPFTVDSGVVGRALKKKRPLVISDVDETDLTGLAVDSLIHSLMVVPILSGAGESLGVILLQSPLVDAFDETGLQLVEAAAVQLGNALNNAELYRLIREQAESLGVMLRSQQIEAAKNEAILEGIADGVMVADATGRVILFNAASEHILSLSRTQALGRFQDEIFGLYGSAAREWMTQIEEWRANPQAHKAESFLAHRLEVGRKIVSVHLSPVMSPGLEFLGVVSVFRDVSAEVAADRAKSEFVSTVSHELRTPMTSIVGYVDLLLAGVTGPLGELQTDFLKKVKTNAGRLTTLVNDLLDISRIETGRVELQRAPVAMEALIEQVSDLLRPKVEDKEQRMRLVLPEGLPKVYGDQARLIQILTNLMGNAYKYTPVGGEIVVYAYVREGVMHVAVSDTGIGIAPENQKKIFDRFYRIEDDPAVYEVSGTGLGLAISLSLIQMHGGEIGLESRLGVGSIFTFSVPLAEGESTADVGARPPSFTDLKMLGTALIVDEDLEFAAGLKTALETEGMQVLTAVSGEAALRLVRQQAPDIVSLDVRLPDLSGFEVLQLLKRDIETADIPIVIVSAVPEKEQGLSLGAVDYLSKPLHTKQFVMLVRRVLEKRGPVLVVDEDRGTLDAVRSVLQVQGVKVCTARSGDAALKLLADLRPALVLVNLTLPDMPGCAVLETLRQHSQTADIPAMVMYNREEEVAPYQERLQELGVVRFLTKPLALEGLSRNISALISGNGGQASV